MVIDFDNSQETQLDEAIRHCKAGMKALEIARESAQSNGRIYPTYLEVAAVELAHSIETALRLALRIA